MCCHSERELGAEVFLGKGDVSLRQRGRWRGDQHCERHCERCTMRPLRRCANAGECMQRCVAPASSQCIAAHLRRSRTVRAAGGRSCQTDADRRHAGGWRLAAFRAVSGCGDFSLGLRRWTGALRSLPVEGAGKVVSCTQWGPATPLTLMAQLLQMVEFQSYNHFVDEIQSHLCAVTS